MSAHRPRSGADPAIADLPDDVLRSVLDSAAGVADAVRVLFTRVNDHRSAMRETLRQEGRIRLACDLPKVPSPRTAGIDGGAAIEQSMGADTAIAVAVGVEGLNVESAHWSSIQYAAWQRILPHAGDQTARACRGIMTALELALARTAPHEVILLDGSHLTPIIALNAMLGVSESSLRQEIASAVREYDTAAALGAVLSAPACIAVVKYDSSRDLTHTWLPAEIRGPGLGLDDRTMMSLLLEAGEYTEPQPVVLTQQSRSNWLAKHIEALDPVDEAREEVRIALNAAITEVNAGRLLVTYYRPHAWAPAFRLEIKPGAATDALQLSRILTTIRDQVVSPEIREPYPQWIADRMAKSAGDALVALRAAVDFNLADGGYGEYVSLLAHSYRTERL